MIPFTIPDNTTDEARNAKIPVNLIAGITNPPVVIPLNVNPVTEISGIITVKTYKRIAFVTNEKNPRVAMLRGRVIIASIGLRISNRNENTIPPIM